MLNLLRTSHWSRYNLMPSAEPSHLAWTANKDNVTVVRLRENDYKHEEIKDETPHGSKEDVIAEDYKQILEKFFTATTIQGVSQIGTRKGFFWKIVWLFVAVCGACMAVYQSRDVIRDYYGDSIIQKMSFKSKNAPFPAVSVCKTMRIKQTEISSGSEEESDFDVTALDLTNANESLNFIRRCKFGSVNCNLSNTEDIVPWTNPKYGLCFTFNPGFEKVKELDTAQVLNLLIDMNTSLESSLLADFTIITIHQSGTPPILHHTRYTPINPKDLYNVKLKARELIKLKDNKECVKPKDYKHTKTLIYYKQSTPYIFTTLVCQKSCEVNRRIKRIGCLDPATVINTSDTPSTAWNSYKFCNSSEMAYDVDQDYKLPCICNFGCRETFLEEASNTRSTTTCKPPQQQNVNNDSVSTLSCAVIKISYGNVPYEIIQEQRKYSDADFWGIIGGNIGLWVGICIISLLEFFELLINIFISLVRNRQWMKRKKKVKEKLPISSRQIKPYQKERWQKRRVFVNPRREARY